ncbi:MAG: GNAT family N-acetyltransferase [Wenzhouxiangellaceae bacterium]
MTQSDSQQVIHDHDGQRFVLTLEGEEVVLKYRQPDDQTIDFYSTYTPRALRGRGLARVVVEAGLAYARAESLRIIATCSYVAHVLENQAQ